MTAPWRRPMGSRDTSEEHRTSTPLERLYDRASSSPSLAPRRCSTTTSATATPGTPSSTACTATVSARLLVALVLVGGATFTGQPVLVTGVVLAALVAALLVLQERASQ